MDPSIAEDEWKLVLVNLAQERPGGREEDEDDDEFDDEDDEDDDEVEDDVDDDVGTDEDGNEMLKVQAPAAGQLPGQGTEAAPDVSSDRVPSTDAEPEGSLAKEKTAPLGIREIENLEDDAKGG